MPVTSPPLSRRRFLAGSLIGLTAAATNEHCGGTQKAVDPNRFVLFSDTHIAGDRATVARGINMTDHLCQAIQEVSAKLLSAGGGVDLWRLCVFGRNCGRLHNDVRVDPAVA